MGPLFKKLEKNLRFHNAFMQLGEGWNLKFHVLEQLEEFTCLVYGQNRESSVDGLRAKLLRKMVGEDEKLTSKSKVNLAGLPPCHCAVKPHLKRVNHRVALYKRADESILEKPKSYDDGQGWMRTEDGVLEPAVLCYQTHWLISWTLVTVKRKKSLTLTIIMTVMVNDESNNYHLEAHERLRRGSSEKTILACYLPRSVNELVNELSGISLFTVP